MPIIRAINLASVLPDLADLPGNRALLTAYMAANGLLANIADLNDAEDIKNQTAGLMCTPDEVIYADVRNSILSSESDIIFDIEDPVLRRAEAIKLLVADKSEINMTYIGLRAIKIASLAKLARHVGADETEINRALAKPVDKAAAFLAAIIVETRGTLTYKGAHAMINNVLAAATERDAEVITKRKADELALARADRQAKRQDLDADIEAKRARLDTAMADYKAGLVNAVNADAPAIDADAPAGGEASHELSVHAQMLKTVSHWSDISVSGHKATLQDPEDHEDTPDLPGVSAAVPMVLSELNLADTLGISKDQAGILEDILEQHRKNAKVTEDNDKKKPILDSETIANIKRVLNEGTILNVQQKSATLSEIASAASADSVQGANRHVSLLSRPCSVPPSNFWGQFPTIRASRMPTDMGNLLLVSMFIPDSEDGTIYDQMHDRSLESDFGEKSVAVSELTSALKGLKGNSVLDKIKKCRRRVTSIAVWIQAGRNLGMYATETVPPIMPSETLTAYIQYLDQLSALMIANGADEYPEVLDRFVKFDDQCRIFWGKQEPPEDMKWSLKDAPDKTNQLDVPLQAAMSQRLATFSLSLQASTGAGLVKGSKQFQGLGGGSKPGLNANQVAHSNLMSEFPMVVMKHMVKNVAGGSKQICFSFARNANSCPKGDKCQYHHLCGVCGKDHATVDHP